jgi:hypothetical protein
VEKKTLQRYVLSFLLAAGLVASCGLGTSPSKPANSLGTSPSVAFVMPGEIDRVSLDGLELQVAGFDFDAGVDTATNADEPAPLDKAKPTAKTTPKWLIQCAVWMLFALGAIRQMFPAFFKSDGWGIVTAFVVTFVYTFLEAFTVRSESLSWGMAYDAAAIAGLATGGYSVLWKKGLKRVLLSVTESRWPSLHLLIRDGFGTSPSVK